jgi:predicted aspartyl protease
MTSTVPFEYTLHCLVIPVRVCGVEAKFVLDTGIGATLISEDLADRVGCHPDGSAFTGRRMSGQDVTVPLGQVESFQVADSQLRDVPVGIFDMHALAGIGEVEGFVSLTCFRTTPVTIDYQAGLLIVEDEASLAQRAAAGAPVPIDVDYDGCSTDVMLTVILPDGKPISVEVDTGSDVLTLNRSLAACAGVYLDGQDVRAEKGADETGYEYTRYFAELRGEVSVSGAPLIRMANPPVMFQDIIYDGLVGDRFLRNFTTTYDLANSRMIFALPS